MSHSGDGYVHPDFARQLRKECGRERARTAAAERERDEARAAQFAPVQHHMQEDVCDGCHVVVKTPHRWSECAQILNQREEDREEDGLRLEELRTALHEACDRLQTAGEIIAAEVDLDPEDIEEEVHALARLRALAGPRGEEPG